MSWVDWKEAYRVGDASIDADHQYLFKLINEFHDSFRQKKDRRELLRVLNNLVAYAEGHFRREELIMAAHGYPLLDAHLVLHEELYDAIYALNERLLEGSDPAENETIAFLRTWLSDHILQHDLAFAEYVRSGK